MVKIVTSEHKTLVPPTLGVAAELLSWLVRDKSAITTAASPRALKAASFGEL